MKKILSLICLMMLAMTSAWAGEVATFNLSKSPGASTPEGFFSHDAAGKWNFNSKFNGAEYDGMSFSNGLKMEGSTVITFSTDFVSTVTIVQSTWSSATIKLDGVELAVADAEAGTGCRIYTCKDVAAGDHTISRGSGESGLFFIKVEWEAEKTVTFINDANWEKVFVWAWNDTENFTGGEWPGEELTANANGEYVWTTKGNPTQILFNDGGSNQTTDQQFKDGGVYKSTGRVIVLSTFTATFKTDGMDEVWAYVWTGDEKPLGEWPGTKLEGAAGEFNVSIEAEEAPKFIIFHDNQGNQTPDWEFVDGKAYEYYLNEYNATFTTDAAWETVNVYAWSGDKEFFGEWPGTELTVVDGVSTLTFKAFSAPENIIFNNGEDKTPDLAFTNGRAYKWNTTMDPICKFEATEETIPAGTTFNVTDGDDVVATLTFGVSGGADFAAPTLRANEEIAAFQYYTGGNGENGSADGGTVYTIKPKYDGTITVGVWLNAEKAFFIQEDGTSLEGFDGIKKSYASGTSFEFDVKAGSEYKVFCTGSKLGFYGFDYKYEGAAQNTYTVTFKTNLVWDAVYAYAWSSEGDNIVEYFGEWPGTQVTDFTDMDDYDVYTLTFKAAQAPEKIIFSNGEGGKVGKYQTDDLEFVDGKEYSLIYEPSELMEQAILLAAIDKEAVAVGKLMAAIQYAYETDDESQLQAAIDQFIEDNKDQEKDETAKVATDGWKNFNGDPAGVCDTRFAPAIETYDGRKNVNLAEVFEGNGNRTGTIIYQDITGLQNGKYKVGFYGNAFSTSQRDGFECTMEDGATDVAYVFANEEKEYITAHIATSTTKNDFRQFDVEVTDGNIKLGMGKDIDKSTNWHTMQIYQLTWFATAKEVYAELQKELDALLFAGAFDLDDENMTEGKEAFRLAYGEASAAKGSNWYNIQEMQDIINKFKAAAQAYQKANWFIDFAEGDYYIIDAETDLKFAAGHNYGTCGIVNEMGLDLKLKPYEESRTVTIDSRVNNGGNSQFLGENLYMDSSEWGWALKYQGFGFYILEPNSGKYINYDADYNLVLSAEPREFIIVKAEEVRNTRKEEMAEATVEKPVDATFLLQDPNFNRNDLRVSAWVFTPMETSEENPEYWNNHNFNGGNGENGNAESFHAAFTTMQTVSDAPAGFYQLIAQGFYRQDEFEGDAPAAPVFFANEVNGDVPAKTGNEGSMGDASTSFTEGKYTIEPITFEVKDDNMMYVGVTTSVHNQWVIFDNFQLLYFGTENPTTGISTVVVNNNQSNAVYNLAGQRVNKAQKGLFIVNGKKVVK